MKFIVYFFKSCKKKYIARYIFFPGTRNIQEIRKKIEFKAEELNANFFLTFQKEHYVNSICPQLCRFCKTKFI